MESLFVPYELALALKELGFDEPCLAYYNKNNSTLKFGEGFELVIREYRRNVMHYPLKNSRYIAGSNAPDGYYYLTTSPTFSQAFRWFREKYEKDSFIARCNSTKEYFFDISWRNKKELLKDFQSEDFKTHKEAELESLKKLIEIVKDK